MIYLLSEIRHTKAGFEVLVDLYNKGKNCYFEDIEINMSRVSWLDADMCAAFGAILTRLSNNVNSIKLTNIRLAVAQILSKNGFLSYYGHEKIFDNWETTIPYKRFDVKDDRFFADYVENKLIDRPEVPTMSIELKKKFKESLFEIFNNAVVHSNTKLGVFSCGQFFPKRNKLDFSVADLGIGIRQNILQATSTKLSATEAIIWATTGNNTTKRGNVPGGLGLKLLCEFIDLNGGCVQIVSDSGYWKREKKEITTSQLSQPFPGTVVNIEINTADLTSYMLSTELTTADIF